MSQPSILVVCTGNICRSPYLERRLQHLVDGAWGAGAVVVGSAGTGALVGAPIDASSGNLLANLGISHADFAARQITGPVVSGAGLVLTATRAHRGLVARLVPRAMQSTFAVADFADLVDRVPNDQMPTTDDPGQWLREVTTLAAHRRGMHLPMDVTQADVVDPYKRGPRVFDEMQRQIEQWMPALRRALGDGRRLDEAGSAPFRDAGALGASGHQDSSAR